jgi:hypothetical protein
VSNPAARLLAPAPRSRYNRGMSDEPKAASRKRSRLPLVIAIVALLPLTYVLAEGPAYAVVDFNDTTKITLRPTVDAIYRPLVWTCNAMGGRSPANQPWKSVRAYEKLWRDATDKIFHR